MHGAHHHVTQFGRSTHNDGKHVASYYRNSIRGCTVVRMVAKSQSQEEAESTVGGCRELEQRIDKIA